MMANGSRVGTSGGAWESAPEAWENPESWETSPEAWENNPEAWEATPEAWESTPEAWENPEAWESSPEAWESAPEAWENPESWETSPEAWENNPEAWEAGFEAWESVPEAWENPEAWETSPEAWENPEAWEADRFLPLIPLAMKALPSLARVAMPAVRRLLPLGRRIAGRVARQVLGGGSPAAAGRPGPVAGAGPAPLPRPGGWVPQSRARSWQGPVGQPWHPRTRATVAGLLRQLAGVLGEGESEAAQLEAELFGANAMNGELAANEQAHEAALTEVLAAEAAHTASEAEAESLLGAALPITITIMHGGRAVRPIYPALLRANRRLVRGIRSSGPSGAQLLRVVPAVQRRTIATLSAASRAGRPVSPQLAAQVMAGHAARVLSNPHSCGPALIRNAAIRHATVRRGGPGAVRGAARQARPFSGEY